jgi:hypothetical protein
LITVTDSLQIERPAHKTAFALLTPSLVEPFGRDNCPKGQNRKNSHALELKTPKFGVASNGSLRCMAAVGFSPDPTFVLTLGGPRRRLTLWGCCRHTNFQTAVILKTAVTLPL